MIKFLFACLLSCLVWFVSPLGAIASVELSPERSAELQTLSDEDIIYLGEIHTEPNDHDEELAILHALYDQNPHLALGFEMFQRPFQPFLDQYLAGEITEAALRTATEYDQRWGFEWEFYAPLLRFAQQHQLPIVALNTPQEITRKVGDRGLGSLQSADFRDIPPLTDIDLGNDLYRQEIKDIFQHHLSADFGANFNGDYNLDYFVEAQILWDETMAEAIAAFVRSKPQTTLLVFVGQAHVASDFAIPDRVTRRLDPEKLKQTVLILSPEDPET